MATEILIAYIKKTIEGLENTPMQMETGLLTPEIVAPAWVRPPFFRPAPL